MKQHSALLNMAGAALNAFNLPLYILLLSAEEYGLWILISSLAAFTALFEFGLSLSMQRAVADGNQFEQYQHTRKIILYSILGCGIVLVPGVVYLNALPSAASYSGQLIVALLLAIAAEALSNINGTYQGVYFAQGKSHVIGIVRILTALFRLTLTWLALVQGLGIPGIAGAFLISQLAELLFYAPQILKRLFPAKSTAKRWAKTDNRSHISFNQWTLNLTQRFSFRILLLVIGVAPITTEAWDSKATSNVLVQIAQMTIIYRIFEVLHLVIKSATPAYYQKILAESKPKAIKTATKTLIVSFCLAASGLLLMFYKLPASQIPSNLTFLHESTTLILLTGAFFLLQLIVEPLQYRAMMREKLSMFKLLQLVLLIVPAIMIFISSPIPATSIMLILCISRLVYLFYITRANKSLGESGIQIIGTSMLKGILSFIFYSLPLLAMLLMPASLKPDYIYLTILFIGTYTAFAIAYFNRVSNAT